MDFRSILQNNYNVIPEISNIISKNPIDYELIFSNPLESLIKNIVNNKHKIVREDILLGEINLKLPGSNISQIRPNNSPHDSNLNVNHIMQVNEDISCNGILVNNMLKSYKIKMTNQKRKNLENQLNLLDSKVAQLNVKFIGKKTDFSPKLFSSKFIISPINSLKKNPRTIKMSDDMERKQKEIDAKIFIKKLNKEKYIRLIREDEKRKNIEKRLLQMASRPNLIRNKSNFEEIKFTEKLLDTGGQQRITKSSYSKKNTPLIEEEEIQLPVIKNDENIKYIEIPTVKKKLIYKLNNENIFNKMSDPLLKSSNNTNRNSKPLQQQFSLNKSKIITTETPIKEEDSLALLRSQINIENSDTYTKRKSPYFFNDPKVSKMLEIKQKFKNNKKHLNSGNDLNFISDGGGNSLEECEILRNWEISQIHNINQNLFNN